MPSDRPRQRLDDILVNIARIERYTTALDRAQFLADTLVPDAVERCLERIAEAARKLGPRYDARFPAVGWPSLRQFGSVLRHDYDDVDLAMLWETVQRRLPPLKACCTTLLADLDSQGT